MGQIAPKSFTLEEFLNLPESKPPKEYINGQILQKPMPQGKHSTIQTELSALINLQLKPDKIARSFCELRCTFGERSIVPDIAVFLWERIPREENGEIANTFNLPPDWTIEILSPDQNQSKVSKNILHCLEYGTGMGWLIDLNDPCVFIYQPEKHPLVIDEPEKLIPVPSFACDLHLTLEGLLSWLRE